MTTADGERPESGADGVRFLTVNEPARSKINPSRLKGSARVYLGIDFPPVKSVEIRSNASADSNSEKLHNYLFKRNKSPR